MKQENFPGLRGMETRKSSHNAAPSGSKCDEIEIFVCYAFSLPVVEDISGKKSWKYFEDLF